MSSLLIHSYFQDRKFFPTNVDKTPKVKAWKADAKKAQEALNFWENETNFAMPTGEGLVVIDIDPKNGGNEEEVYKLGFPQGTFKVRTPSGGCHLYYRPEGFNLQTGVNRLGPGIDIRSDGGYVCVPPKAGYEIVCDHIPKSVQAIEVRAAIAIQEEKKVELLKQVDSDIVVVEGSRNDTLFREGCSLRAKGVPEIILRAGLQAINEQLCNPPLTEREVEVIVQQALKYMPGEQADDGLECKWWNAKELFLDFGEAVETFVWESHIPAKMASMIVARGGQGKSSFLLYIVRDILDKDPDATVLWLPVENNMFDTRIKMQDMGLGEHERFFVGGKVKPGEKHGSFCYDFSKPGDQLYLENMIRGIKPTIVIVDSLRAMSSVDLNQKGIGDVMSKMQSIVCEQGQAALVYIHHCNKKSEGKDVDKIMGNSSIDAQVRLVFSLDYKDQETRILKPIKNNMLKKPAYLAFVKDAHGYNHTEISEEEAMAATEGGPTGQDGLSLTQEQEMDRLWDEMIDLGETYRWLVGQYADYLRAPIEAAWQYVNTRKKRHGRD